VGLCAIERAFSARTAQRVAVGVFIGFLLDLDGTDLDGSNLDGS
jgi:hypothetical protein